MRSSCDAVRSGYPPGISGVATAAVSAFARSTLTGVLSRLLMLSAVHHSRAPTLLPGTFFRRMPRSGNAGPSFRIVIVAMLLDSACADRYRCRGDGFVDEDGCDGGGGGEGFGVEDSAAGRGAI